MLDWALIPMNLKMRKASGSHCWQHWATRANKVVLPQPPGPYNTKGIGLSPFMYLQRQDETVLGLDGTLRFNFVNRFLPINTTLCSLLAKARLLVELLEQRSFNSVARF